jgi:hypothetical protein
MQELFFELLRVAVGQMDCLSRGPSVEEWNGIFQTAQRHGLVGVCYKGVERLFDFGLRAPHDLSIDWMADAEMLRDEQELYENRCEKLVKKLAERKLHAAVMNGLGERHYDDSEMRHLLKTPSIDIFVDCNMDRIVKFVHQTGQEDVYCGYTSLALTVWDNTPVNLYYRVLSMRNPFVNKRMQKWFAHNKELMFLEGEGDWLVPTLTMNAICMLQTFQQRLLSGKATMCCLVDYYYVLSRLKGAFQPFKDGCNMTETLQLLGLTQFAAGVMWVLQYTLSLDRSCMLCEPSETEGRFILRCLMARKRSFKHLLLHYPMEMIWPSR